MKKTLGLFLIGIGLKLLGVKPEAVKLLEKFDNLPDFIKKMVVK